MKGEFIFAGHVVKWETTVSGIDVELEHVSTTFPKLTVETSPELCEAIAAQVAYEEQQIEAEQFAPKDNS